MNIESPSYANRVETVEVVRLNVRVFWDRKSTCKEVPRVMSAGLGVRGGRWRQEILGGKD